MKKSLILAAMLVAGTANASAVIKYDCDYTFDNHDYSAVIKYNYATEALIIGGEVHGQDFRSVLNYKSRYQLFKNTAIIRDRFSGKLLSNSHEIKNLQCEIFGA